MVNKSLLKVSQNLIRLRRKKEEELKRREKREKELQVLADNEYKKNKEQWEALNVCIKHQQERSIVLICDLMTIKKMLDRIYNIQRRSNHDWYA